MEDILNPITKSLGETTNSQYFVQGGPGNRIEGLPEVKLEDHGWSFARVASADEVCCKDVVFGNIPAGDEPCLITMNQTRNERFEARSEDFSNSFNWEVL